MEALFFNSTGGYLEGIVRGFKAGLLTQAQYSNLTQCETLDGELHSYPSTLLPRLITPRADFRMQLSATDYGNFLANETPPISTSTIAEKEIGRAHV